MDLEFSKAQKRAKREQERVWNAYDMIVWKRESGKRNQEQDHGVRAENREEIVLRLLIKNWAPGNCKYWAENK